MIELYHEIVCVGYVGAERNSQSRSDSILCEVWVILSDVKIIVLRQEGKFLWVLRIGRYRLGGYNLIRIGSVFIKLYVLKGGKRLRDLPGSRVGGAPSKS